VCGKGSFYPRGLKSSDCLSYYADHFDSVEVDSTFYACPSAKTVSGWFSRTPDNLIFSVKAPQTITHDKVLIDCDFELKEFLDTMGILGTKLGPIVFQFPFFNRNVLFFRDRHEFVDRFVSFLKKLLMGQKMCGRASQQELARRRICEPPARSLDRSRASGPLLDAESF
jgi:uncharacterized protein YecE (DUF72 family)